MRRWASILSILFLLCGQGVPVNAEEPVQTVHLYVHDAADLQKPCSEAVYGVYQDAEGTVPLKDAQGQTYLFKTDEKGESSLDLPVQPFFLKVQTPAKGYYAQEQVTAGQKELSLSADPIRFAFTAGERIPQMQLKRDDGTCIPLTQAVAGVTYTAVEADAQNYHAAAPVSVAVPLYRDEKNDPVYIQTEDTAYGKADVLFKDGETVVEGIKYEVYQDEQCTKKTEDVFGAELTKISEKEKQSLLLTAGTWYLKINDLSQKYAVHSDTVPFTVVEGRDIKVDVQLQKMTLTVHVIDGMTGHDLPADITCMQDSLELPNTDGYQIARNQTYTIKTVLKGQGYFAVPLQTVSSETSPLNITLKAFPFAVHVNGVDAETGNDVAMKYEIRTQEGAAVKEIHAGDTVIFHETECEEGYESSADQTLTIPLNSSKAADYEIQFAHVPYVDCMIHAPQDASVALYTDAACTQTAVDRFGKNAEGITAGNQISFSMHTGMYYAKEESVPAGYRMDGMVRPVICQHQYGTETELFFYNPSIALNIVSTKEEQPAEGITYSILENGELISSFTSKGDDLVNQGLNAGHTYEVAVSSVDGQYLYQGKQSVTIPESGETQTLQFNFQPYTDLSLTLPQKAEVQGTLYRDQSCQEKASDIYGRICEAGFPNDHLTWEMAPGTYWFATASSPHYYRSLTKIDISADEKQKKVEIEMTPAGVTIEIVNQSENDHMMELLDYRGSLVKTWIADEETKEVEADAVKPGESYTIKDKDTGEETQFTVPETEPSQKPIVKVEQKESDKDVQKQDQVPNVLWMVGGAAVLLLGAGGGLLLHHKHDENIFKK